MYKCSKSDMPIGRYCKDLCCISCKRFKICESRCQLTEKRSKVPNCPYIFKTSRGKAEIEKMYQEALLKLVKEMEHKSDNRFVQLIGLHVIERLNKNKELADGILDEEKSIEGSFKSTKLLKDSNMTKEQAYENVRKYFGMED
jgi:hypothetical protein